MSSSDRITTLPACEGWTNYPTWAVNLRLANDHGLYVETCELANVAVESAGNCEQVEQGVWTVEQAQQFWLEDRIQDMVERLVELEDRPADLLSDLVSFAIQLVSWPEIAASWLADARQALES